MVENSYFRTALMIIFASVASLSAEAWLSAGENGDLPAPEPTTFESPENLPELDDELALPDETVGVFTADLKDRLERDLRVRLPADFEFIDRVIELVENDTLPLKIVNRCYLWARQQRVYQFQYFRSAIRKQAGQIGVSL